ILELVVVLACHAAQQGVGVAAPQQHGADQGVVLAYHRLGNGGRDTLAALELVVGVPGFAEPAVVFGVDDLDVLARHQAQASLLDTHLDDRRAAYQYGVRELFVNDGLRRAQHAFVFAVGVDNALGRLFGLREQRAHQLARVVHEAHQLLAIAFDVLDGSQGNARVGGRLRDGRRDLYDQARVEGLGNDVFGPERQVLAIVGAGHFIVLFGLRQLGNGFHAGELHFLGDAGRAR